MKTLKLSKFGDYEKIIYFPVFSNFQVHVVFSHDLSESYRRRYGHSVDVTRTDAFHRYTENGHSHLFFSIGECPIGTVAHESFHVVWALLLQWAGVEKDAIDNELVAYHLGYLVNEISSYRSWLIDSGVKSSKEVTDENRTSQRSHGKLSGVYARSKEKTKKGASGAHLPKRTDN
jgi:hypothetical protein